MNKENLINHLGADRSGKLERLRPGCLESGLQSACNEGAVGRKGLALAAVRAIQAAGCAPSASDLKAWKEADDASTAPVDRADPPADPDQSETGTEGSRKASRASHKPKAKTPAE